MRASLVLLALLLHALRVYATSSSRSCNAFYVRWPRVRLNFKAVASARLSLRACESACSLGEDPIVPGRQLECAALNHYPSPDGFSHHCDVFQPHQLQNVDGYVEADDRYSFYWKYCLQSTRKCSGDYAFTYLSDRYMDPKEVIRISKKNSLEECLTECLEEKSLPCRSISFNRTDGGCHLSANSQLTKPQSIRLNQNPNFRIDYYENNCYNLSETFKFEEECREDGVKVRVKSRFPYTGALYGLYDFFTCRVEPKEETDFSYFFPFPTFSKNCSDSIRYKGNEVILEVVLSTDGVEPLYFITPDDLTFQAKCPLKSNRRALEKIAETNEIAHDDGLDAKMEASAHALFSMLAKEGPLLPPKPSNPPTPKKDVFPLPLTSPKPLQPSTTTTTRAPITTTTIKTKAIPSNLTSTLRPSVPVTTTTQKPAPTTTRSSTTSSTTPRTTARTTTRVVTTTTTAKPTTTPSTTTSTTTTTSRPTTTSTTTKAPTTTTTSTTTTSTTPKTTTTPSTTTSTTTRPTTTTSTTTSTSTTTTSTSTRTPPTSTATTTRPVSSSPIRPEKKPVTAKTFAAKTVEIERNPELPQLPHIANLPTTSIGPPAPSKAVVNSSGAGMPPGFVAPSVKNPVLFEIYHNGQPVEAVVVGTKITLAFTPHYPIPPRYMTIMGCQVEPVDPKYEWEREPLVIVKDGCQSDLVGLVCPPTLSEYGVKVSVESFRYQTTPQVQYSCLVRICPFAPCPMAKCGEVDGCAPPTFGSHLLERQKRGLSLEDIRKALEEDPSLASKIGIPLSFLSPQTTAAPAASLSMEQQLRALAGDHVVKRRLVVVNSEDQLKYYVRTGSIL